MSDTAFTTLRTTITSAWAQVINNFVYRGKRPTYGTTTGAANVFSLALDSSSLVTAAGLADGDSFLFRAHQANSGAATFALTVGATTIGSAAIQVAGSALAGGEILSDGIYQITRVGATWQLNGQALAITIPLPVAQGGTGATTAPDALTALGGTAVGTAVFTAVTAAAARVALDVPSNSEAILDTIINAKGDMIVGTANDTPAIKSAPSDAYVRIADSTQSDGWLDIPYTGNKNAIIGGDFGTNPWQRGTSFTSIATDAYSADRWLYNKSGTMVHDITRATDQPTVAEAGYFTNQCLMIDCTTADGTIAAADFCFLRQKIEGYNFRPLAQRAFTLSFWHKHTKTGTYCVAFRNSGNDRSWIAEYTQDVTDTWERATVTVTASPSGGTWDYTNGVGLEIDFILAAGTNFHSTAGSWLSSGAIATANQVNACDSTSNNFKLALIQLEAGSVATEFESRSVQQELALCQRYFFKTFVAATAPAQNAGVDSGEFCFIAGKAGAAGEFSTKVPFPVLMRATPTFTLYNPANANAQVRDETASGDCSGSTVLRASDFGFAIQTTGNASTAVGNLLGVHVTASAEL